MRITGGTLKGRTVECPPGVIRPAMDKMKESVFSILGDLSGRSFLDLFSGSGSIALEAFSRGAGDITMVEKDRGKIPTILKNMALAERKIECRFMAAELFIKRNKKQFDIIFCDPPFPYNFHRELIELCAEHHALADDGILLIHRPSERALPAETELLVRYDERIFGRSVVDFYRKKDA